MNRAFPMIGGRLASPPYGGILTRKITVPITDLKERLSTICSVNSKWGILKHHDIHQLWEMHLTLGNQQAGEDEAPSWSTSNEENHR